MKIIIALFAIITLSACSSIPQDSKPVELVKIGEGKYEVENLAKYARQNNCKEYFVRGKFYCEDGRKFRAVTR